MERDILLAAEKNLGGKRSSFTILPLSSNSHFLKVAKGSHVNFRPEKGSSLAQISNLRAQELVQAALAEGEAKHALLRTRAAEAKAMEVELHAANSEALEPSAGPGTTPVGRHPESAGANSKPGRAWVIPHANHPKGQGADPLGCNDVPHLEHLSVLTVR